MAVAVLMLDSAARRTPTRRAAVQRSHIYGERREGGCSVSRRCAAVQLAGCRCRGQRIAHHVTGRAVLLRENSKRPLGMTPRYQSAEYGQFGMRAAAPALSRWPRQGRPQPASGRIASHTIAWLSGCIMIARPVQTQRPNLAGSSAVGLHKQRGPNHSSSQATRYSFRVQTVRAIALGCSRGADDTGWDRQREANLRAKEGKQDFFTPYAPAVLTPRRSIRSEK